MRLGREIFRGELMDHGRRGVAVLNRLTKFLKLRKSLIRRLSIVFGFDQNGIA